MWLYLFFFANISEISRQDLKMELVPGLKNIYYFPDDKRIGVNKQGVLFNLKTKRVLKQHRTKSGYLNVVITSPGIKHMGYLVHRVIARTFIKRPEHLKDVPFDELFVNHDDAVKHNNKISNLEWTTPQGNVLHAHKNGLITRITPVQIKELATGKVETLPSMRALCRAYGFCLPTIAKHLNTKFAGRYDYGGYVIRQSSTDPWPELIHSSRRPNSLTFSFMLQDQETKKKKYFKTLREVSNETKLNYTTLWKRLFGKVKEDLMYRKIHLKELKNDLTWCISV